MIVVLRDGADSVEFEVRHYSTPSYILHGPRAYYLTGVEDVKLVYRRVAEVPHGWAALFIPAGLSGGSLS